MQMLHATASAKSEKTLLVEDIGLSSARALALLACEVKAQQVNEPSKHMLAAHNPSGGGFPLGAFGGGSGWVVRDVARMCDLKAWTLAGCSHAPSRCGRARPEAPLFVKVRALGGHVRLTFRMTPRSGLRAGEVHVQSSLSSASSSRMTTRSSLLHHVMRVREGTSPTTSSTSYTCLTWPCPRQRTTSSCVTEVLHLSSARSRRRHRKRHCLIKFRHVQATSIPNA